MFKGIGLPIPSGQYRVGCVDVMPLCPGEERGLLFRLYYPTEATPDSGYHYPPWLPNKLYAKGYLLFKRYSSFVAGALGSLINGFCGKCQLKLRSHDIKIDVEDNVSYLMDWKSPHAYKLILFSGLKSLCLLLLTCNAYRIELFARKALSMRLLVVMYLLTIHYVTCMRACAYTCFA